MTIHLFERSQLPATPWKNGGGVTREITCRLSAADVGDQQGFDWRISIAHIESDGPFSPFDGIDRVITLLEGGGVRLQSTDGKIDHPLDQPLVPFAFPGEAPIQATLLNGDCHDFNVMTRRDRCQASVRVWRKGGSLPTTPDGLLLVINGRWQIYLPDGTAHALGPNAGLWWQQEPASLRIDPLPALAPGATSIETVGPALLVVSITNR